MNRKKCSVQIVALATALICALNGPLGAATAYAAETGKETQSWKNDVGAGEAIARENIIKILTIEDLEALARQCSLDQWSVDKYVVLEADLDLTDSDFSGIPTFGGTFDGNGHTISGFSMTKSGDVNGFFRYVQEGASVVNLTVSGEVAPDGHRDVTGGLAGNNKGMLSGCRFVGTVKGKNRTGGVVGLNEAGGQIYNCSFEGDVTGEHYAGGIVGENLGSVVRCKNSGSVNITEVKVSTEITEFGLETLSQLNSASNMPASTDIGGIAGVSSGILQSCVNEGDVGYPHTGYNVGGIVGRQSGYLDGCENSGTINGRKDVGGIVGQFEPEVTLQFEPGMLEDLYTELEVLQGLIDTTIQDAKGISSSMSNSMSGLSDSTKNVKSATQGLSDSMIDWADENLEAINDFSARLSWAIDQMVPVADAMSDSMDSMGDAAGLLSDALNEGKLMLGSGTELAGDAANAIRQFENAVTAAKEAAESINDALQKLGEAIGDDQKTQEMLHVLGRSFESLGSILEEDMAPLIRELAGVSGIGEAQQERLEAMAEACESLGSAFRELGALLQGTSVENGSISGSDALAEAADRVAQAGLAFQIAGGAAAGGLAAEENGSNMALQDAYARVQKNMAELGKMLDEVSSLFDEWEAAAEQEKETGEENGADAVRDTLLERLELLRKSVRTASQSLDELEETAEEEGADSSLRSALKEAREQLDSIAETVQELTGRLNEADSASEEEIAGKAEDGAEEEADETGSEDAAGGKAQTVSGSEAESESGDAAGGKTQTVSGSEAESENGDAAGGKAQTVSGSEAESESGDAAGGKAQTVSGSEAESGSGDAVGGKTQTVSGSEAESESGDAVGGKTQTGAEAESGSETASEGKAQTVSGSEAESESGDAAGEKVQTGAEAESGSETASEGKAQTVSGSESESESGDETGEKTQDETAAESEKEAEGTGEDAAGVYYAKEIVKESGEAAAAANSAAGESDTSAGSSAGTGDSAAGESDTSAGGSAETAASAAGDSDTSAGGGTETADGAAGDSAGSGSTSSGEDQTDWNQVLDEVKADWKSAESALTEAFKSLYSSVEVIGDCLDQLAEAGSYGANAVGILSKASISMKDSFRSLSSATSGLRDTLSGLAQQPAIQFTPLDSRVTTHKDALDAALDDMTAQIDQLNSTMTVSSDVMLADMEAINRQFGVIIGVLKQESEEESGNIDDHIVDISDEEEVEDQPDGCVSGSTNRGEIYGDVNVAGIVGSMAIEYDFDLEDDLTKVGETSADFSWLTSAVLSGCINLGAVEAKKDCAGGIVGRMDMGKVGDCESYGAVSSSGGSYVGGIAGASYAAIRDSWAKCALSGADYVGGIAGWGTTITNCHALVEITESSAFAGSIAGKMSDSGELSGNTYVHDSLAAVDGISYVGQAEPVQYDELLSAEGTPEKFKEFELTFTADGEVVSVMTFQYGKGIKSLPEIPAKEGYSAKWPDLDYSHLTFSQTLEAEYTAYESALSAGGEIPELLVDGSFSSEASVEEQTQELTFADAKGREHTGTAVTVRVQDPVLEEVSYTVHYKLPEDGNSYRLWVLTQDGWEKRDYDTDGNYLLLKNEGEEVTFLLEAYRTPWEIAAVLAAAAVLLLILALRRRKKGKKQK